MVLSRLSTGNLIFLISLIFFISITNGNFWESDSRAVYETTRSLISSGRFNIDCIFGELSSDGQCYSKYGLFMSVAIVPLSFVDKVVREFFGITYFFDGFFSSWTNSFISALLVWLIFKLLVRLGFSEKLSVGCALVFAFCTYVPAYTKTLFSEPLETLLILGSLYALSFRKNGFVLSGYLLGFALLTKISVLTLIPCYIAFFLYKNITFRQFFSFLIPVVACLLIFFGYNYVRFGDPLNTGYNGVKFDYPLIKGLILHLFSSGKSIFLYMPVLVISLPGLKYFFLKQKILFVYLALVNIITLFFYSTYMHPAGDWAWGSRYLYIVVPFFIFGLAYFLERNKSRVLRQIFIVLIIISFVIQLTSVYLGNHRYYAYLTRKYKLIPWDQVYFNPFFSPLLNQQKIIFRIGYSESEKVFWREAFQEYISFNPDQLISDPDMFFLRSKKEFLIFLLLMMIETLLIAKLLVWYRFSQLHSFILLTKRKILSSI